MSLEKHMFLAVQNGLLEIKNNKLVLTYKGILEFNDISFKCMDILNDSGENIPSAAAELSATTGTTVTPLELFQTLMIGLNGTEASALCFLLNERDVDFKYLKSTVNDKQGSTEQTVRSLSSLNSKKKYDA